MRATRLVLILAVPLFACAPQGEQQAETSESAARQSPPIEMASGAEMEATASAISGMIEQYIQAFEAGNAESLANLFASDGVRMQPNEPMAQGRRAVEQTYTEQFAGLQERNLEVTSLQNGASGALAYDYGTYQVSGNADGQPIQDEGKYLILLKRATDGSWKIHAQIYNSNLPAEPATAAE